MNAISNIRAINPGQSLLADNIPISVNKKLLLITYSVAAEKEKMFAGTDIMVINNLACAEEIINKEFFFDAIFCDTEVGKKDITDFISFFKSNKISSYLPFLLLDFQNKPTAGPSLKNLDGVDDFITNNINAIDLNNKIETLKKYKFYQQKLPYTTESLKVNTLNYKKINHQYILKRILDIVLASTLLLLVSPLIIFIAIAIKLESKGPVFYKSLRAGRWYKVFKFYKFRTMVVNADSMIANLQYMNEYKDQQTSFFFKMKDDPRVTRVGKILRNTSLDELPQLFNVIKGDMSIVGNRPLPLYEAQTITTDKSAKRFFATAGITGLWQVNGRSNPNLSTSERIAMDIDYADKSSLLLDLKILLKTPKELIHKGNV